MNIKLLDFLVDNIKQLFTPKASWDPTFENFPLLCLPILNYDIMAICLVLINTPLLWKISLKPNPKPHQYPWLCPLLC